MLDSYWFGKESLASCRNGTRLEELEGDIRDPRSVKQALVGADTVVHLACISNDPSCELDAALTEEVNFRSFEPLVVAAREAGVRRFVFASSSSVYGISDAPEVTEEHPRRPITAYNDSKARCEDVLWRHQVPGFTTVALRPATLCGVSSRQRLDLTVNVLTIHALEKREITVFGGQQMRPNLHLDDMVDLYVRVLEVPEAAIAGQAFNVSQRNYRVEDVAKIVQQALRADAPELGDIRIRFEESDDLRSYHVNTDKLFKALDYRPARGIEIAIRDLLTKWRSGALSGALGDARYFNVRHMSRLCQDGVVRVGAW